ncbi:hypothetical protein BDF14DRAFT_1960288 [Spinellus fusiger]|nr:hypothetical protein BDF14DRAFT_1960288 [Spinellus fusiger]
MDDPQGSSPASTRRRSRHPLEKQTLEFDRLGHKSQRLLASGYHDEAIHILLHPDRQTSRGQYKPIQQKYITWAQEHSIDPFIANPVHIINFLAFGRSHNNWSTSTCATYRSAILDLYGEDKALIVNDAQYKDFFTALNETTVRPVYNIKPVLDQFYAWAITGFLRPADIERINLDHVQFTNGPDASLKNVQLVVDRPKEKRLGQPIERSIHIKHHPDPLLCPVLALQHYIATIATQPCHLPHPVRPSRTINYLVRHIRDPSRPLSAERIGKYINGLTDLIPRCQSSRPRTRALGSSAAARFGVPIDDILTHGSWASSSVFDTFYRLSRETATDFTSVTLGSGFSPGRTLDTQSESPTHEE